MFGKCSFDSHRVTAEHFTIFLRILFAAFPRYFLRYPFANPLFGKVFGRCSPNAGVWVYGPTVAETQKCERDTAMNTAVEQDQRVLTLAEASPVLCKVSETNFMAAGQERRSAQAFVLAFSIPILIVRNSEAWAIAQGKDE